MFSDRALLGPTGRRTYSTRETPVLRAREWVLTKVGQKGGVRKNKGKEKSIVVRQNLIILLLLRHLVVPPTFLSGSTPLSRTSGVWGEGVKNLWEGRSGSCNFPTDSERQISDGRDYGLSRF